MRNKKNKHLGIEIDPALHYKLHYISKYYGRSANGEILFLIRQAIKDSDLVVLESNYDPQRLRNNPLYPEYLKRRIASEDSGHLSNYQCGDALMSIRPGQRVFLGHLSKKNNDPDLAKDTVSETSGIRRAALDCLDCNLDDTRALKI